MFIRNCRNCNFTIAAKQLRVRDCSNCAIHLYVKTEPVIETSIGLKFAPFAAEPSKVLKEANLLDESGQLFENKWDKVFDFSNSTNDSKNFEIVKESDERDGYPFLPASCRLGVQNDDQNRDENKEVFEENLVDKLSESRSPAFSLFVFFWSNYISQPLYNSILALKKFFGFNV